MQSYTLWVQSNVDSLTAVTSFLWLQMEERIKIIKTMILDTNECQTGSPCHSNAICNNTDGSYICTCDSGYSGDGFTCSGKTTDDLSSQTFTWQTINRFKQWINMKSYLYTLQLPLGLERQKVNTHWREFYWRMGC